MRFGLAVIIFLSIVSTGFAAPSLYLTAEEPTAAVQAVPLAEGSWLVVGEPTVAAESVEPLRDGYYYLFYGSEAPAGVEVVAKFAEAYLLFGAAPLPGFIGGELVLLHPSPSGYRRAGVTEAQYTPPAPFGGGEVDADLLKRISEPTYRHDIEELVAIPTRYSYTQGCLDAAAQISDKLSAWGYEPYYHRYEFGAQGTVAIWDIDAVDTNTAYAVTRSVALKTTDGGTNWNPLDDTLGFYMRTCHLGDDGTLYIAAFDDLLISHDGGESFTKIMDCWSTFAVDLKFTDADHGWACGATFVSWTSDGGETWTEGIGDLDYVFNSLAIQDDTQLVVGDGGGMRRSVDGGVNWTTINSGTSNRLYSVCFGDANNAWSVGAGGTILYSDDAGLTWSEQVSNFSLNIYRVEFIDVQIGYASGDNQYIFKTIDGGANWDVAYSSDNGRSHALEVTDAESFWVGGGDPPFVYYSTDSGEHLTGGEIDLDEDQSWRNVVCELHAEDDTQPALLITGHYDSISDDPFVLALGADDNGSGVTAMLAIARAFYDQTFATPVRLVFFSGEEQGLIGSSYYVDEMIAEGEVGGVINLDMYAYKDDEELDLQAYTENNSLWLSEVFKESVEANSAATVVETNDPSFRRSDHASFWTVGIPAIQVGEYPGTGWYPYYHTTQDTLQYVNMEQALAGAVGAAAATMTLVPRVETAHDTAEVYTYPNPFRPYRGDDTIIFRNLPAGAGLSIFDLAGALVYETTVSGEPFTWAGVNQAGSSLASGVYLYHVKTAGTTQIGKLAIIR